MQIMTMMTDEINDLSQKKKVVFKALQPLIEGRSRVMDDHFDSGDHD